MDKILINDLLRLSAHDISNTRLKLNVFNGNTDPLEEYKKDPDKINTEWFLWHNQRRYFHTGQIAICLLYLHDDKWLLTTIKRIVKELDVVDNVGFEASEIDVYRKYFGRLVLKYHNTKRGMGRTYMSIMDELEVIELLPTAYDGDDFPGYENIRLSFSQLEAIICNKRMARCAAESKGSLPDYRYQKWQAIRWLGNRAIWNAASKMDKLCGQRSRRECRTQAYC